MIARAAACGAILLALLSPADAADLLPDVSPSALAAGARAAMRSEGFEVRLSLTTVDPDGHRSLPVRLAVVGRIEPHRTRLAVRGISPEPIRDRRFAAQGSPDGNGAFAYGPGPADLPVPVDPHARLFGTGLVLWDLLAPWWDWPVRLGSGVGHAGENACIEVRSVAESVESPIQEVASCIDPKTKIALRTVLLDRNGRVVRTILVEETMRHASGRTAPRKTLVSAADRSAVEIEVYSGDEDYSVSSDTFAVLDGPASSGR